MGRNSQIIRIFWLNNDVFYSRKFPMLFALPLCFDEFLILRCRKGLSFANNKAGCSGDAQTPNYPKLRSHRFCFFDRRPIAESLVRKESCLILRSAVTTS